MLRMTLVTLTLGLCATGAMAEDAMTDLDVNGDGFFSFPELSVAYPLMTAEEFAVMDTTGDGLLDMAEIEDATAAGLWPEMQQ